MSAPPGSAAGPLTLRNGKSPWPTISRLGHFQSKGSSRGNEFARGLEKLRWKSDSIRVELFLLSSRNYEVSMVFYKNRKPTLEEATVVKEESTIRFLDNTGHCNSPPAPSPVPHRILPASVTFAARICALICIWSKRSIPFVKVFPLSFFLSTRSPPRCLTPWNRACWPQLLSEGQTSRIRGRRRGEREDRSNFNRPIFGCT